MNNTLLESLLNEEEGTALDFKAQQYEFAGATDDQKSELLKDIVAMANSWRRSDAYILLGVQEVPGGRSKVVGVTTHLADASIQQFVNSKLQRPIVCSYEVYLLDETQIGIIQIPLQERPFYLNKPYGKLSAKTVYLRRGSSTDTAAPDEISKMGLAKQEDFNRHLELQALIEELELFLGVSSRVNPVEARARYVCDQYRRLFDKGVVVQLAPELRVLLRDAYSEIMAVGEIINVAWNSGRGCNIWAMNVNEANDRLRGARSKATAARDSLRGYLLAFGS
jgi:hypothetical protein